MGHKRGNDTDEKPCSKRVKQTSTTQRGCVVECKQSSSSSIVPLQPGTESDPSELLTRLIAPVPVDEFLCDVWAQDKVLVLHPEQGTDRIQELLSDWLFDLDLRSLLDASATDVFHVWMRALANSTDGGEQEVATAANSFEVGSVDAANACHAAGASLYFRAPENLEQFFIRQVCDGLGVAFAVNSHDEIETFVSRKGHVTDWHWDFQHNFTIQLKGVKRWSVCPSVVKDPLRACAPHFKDTGTVEQQTKLHTSAHSGFSYQRSDFSQAQQVTLVPGSVMYFPSGMWHKVECLEDSVSINVSLVPKRMMNLALEGLQHVVQRDSLFRQHFLVPPPSSASDQTHPLYRARDAVQQTLDRLKSSLEQLRADFLVPPFLLKYRPYHKKSDLRVDLADLCQQLPRVSDDWAQLTVNPVALLLHADQVPSDASEGAVPEDDDDDAEEEEEEEEEAGCGQGGDEEEDEENEHEHDNEEEEQEEEGGCCDDGEHSGEGGCCAEQAEEVHGDERYMVHFQFGTEDVTSAYRVCLHASSPALADAMKHAHAVLRDASNKPYDATRLCRVSRKEFADCEDILSVLVYFGVLCAP